MSTKTSIKRIAAVAAVALTLGGFSAVSAHATMYSEALSLSSASASINAGETATVVVSDSFLSTNADATTAAAFLISSPAGNVVLPTLSTTTAQDTANAAGNVNVGASTISGQSAVITAATGAAVAVSAAYTLSLVNVQVAGTYVVKVIPAATNSSAVTWTVTVAAKAPVTAASSTAYIAAGTTTPSSVTDALAVAAVKTLPATFSAATAAANVHIAANNATSNGVADTLSAVVSGPGNLSFDGGTTTGRSVAKSTKSLTGDLLIFADGVAGVSTISIYSGTTLLATKTVTFYGTVASFSASAVAIANGDTAGTQAAVIQVIAKDSLGNLVPNAPVTVSAADKTVVVSGAGTSATQADIDNAVGAVGVSVVGAKYGKIALTVASTDSTVTATATVTLTVSSATAKTVTLSTDSSSYAAGSLITLTESAVDANGLPVADGATRAALKSNFLVQVAGANANTALAAGAFTGGAYVVKVFAPVNQGTLTFSDTATTGAIAAPLSVEITNPAADSAQAAIDAAQEATDAANAAYDAANNAMDSADAATAAAQDASDNASAALAAVTSLSATVAKLVSSVTAIATALASIKKKLGVK